jgi:predicted TIM-barrel fold metal-dependent hydrolase
MIIDFHTHVFPPQVKKKRDRYVAADPSFALLYSNKKARLATTEELIASMDQEEIDVSVILNIGWTTHDLCVETNDYILESIARYPNRLIGFGAVQPLSPEAAAREIERCAQGGMRGIGELRPDVQLLDLADTSVTEPFFATLRQHNLILLVHASEPVGHCYPGKGSVTPELLYDLITGLPEHPIVCAHWGGGLPFYALMPEVKAALANVFFDTAASPYLYQPRIYPQVAELAGRDKILFGSDWPLLRPSRLREEIDSLDLPPETRELILSGNAQRLLNIERAPGKG